MSYPRLSHFITGAISLALFVAVLVTLHHILREVEIADITGALARTQLSSVALAILFTAVSYLMLSGYDAIAIHQLDRSLPYPVLAFASFASYSIAHNVGLSVLASGSVRYRIYAPFGLTAGEVVRVTAICSFTFALAVALLVGTAMTLEPERIALIDQLPASVNRLAGIATLVVLAGYVMWIAFSSRRLEIAGWHLQLPNLPMTLLQFLVGSLDIFFASLALYLLLPGDVPMGFVAFIGIYVTASAISFISHIPGGLGVLEAGMLLALPELPPHELLASLLVFRLSYYVLPFLLATIMLLGLEAARSTRFAGRYTERLQPLVKVFAPTVMGLLVLAAGAGLLITDSAPAFSARLRFVDTYLPLSLIEASHLLGAFLGVPLLILARGLFRRLAGAWKATLGLLALAIPITLVKGLVYEEALFLTLVAALLLFSRRAFYRKSSLFDVSFPASWIVAIAGILALSVAVGLFAFKRVEYSPELWWQFTTDGAYSRFLRSSLVALVTAAGFFVLRLVRRTPAKPEGSEVLALVRSIVARSPDAAAALALTGDKQFLLSDDGRAFIMYAVSGSSWVALGDPIGDPSVFRSLVWQFREMVDRHGGTAAFFDTSATHLPLYLDIGLTATPIGERALVPLAGFSLEDPDRAPLRDRLLKAERQGLSVEIVPAARVRALLPTLRAINDDWLQWKKAAEKGFSQGFFAEDTIAAGACALLRHNGQPVAFASLLSGADGAQLMIDVLRLTAAAPEGARDMLFARLMQWGRDEGYGTLDLGLAPLADITAQALAPTWAQVTVAVFRHGEHFDSFAAIRADREKYRPHWSPRYLVCPGDLMLPRVLRDAAALICPGCRLHGAGE